MAGLNGMEFAIVLALGVLGTVLALPYLLQLYKDQLAQVTTPRPVMLAVIIGQGAVFTAISAGLGLLAANAIGLERPVLAALVNGEPLWPALATVLPLAVVVGVSVAAAMLLLEIGIFLPHLPQALLDRDKEIKPWQKMLASFYGGFTEEIIMRLLLLSGAAWLLGQLWQTPEGLPTVGVFWLANVAVGVLFGLGHLPATQAITPLTRTLVVRGILLNLIGALAFGYLFWHYGLIAAMAAHFTTDIFFHVIVSVSVKTRARRRATAHPIA